MTRPILTVAAAFACLGAASAELPKTGAELYRLTNLVSAHLIFAPDQWQAIQPEEPAGGPFGGPPGGGPGRGPGGPGGGFNPGGMLVPGFLRTLDGNQDGQVSRAEFTDGFTKWFKNWDTKRQGYLTPDDVRDGLNKDLNPTPAGGPGGGPGAPGGGPPGMNLQGREGGRNGLSAMRGIEFDYVRAHLEFDGQRLNDIAVRYKGNGTYMQARETDKKSFKLDLNDFVKGQKIAGATKLNLHNNISDPAWMHEPIAYALYRAAGVPAPRTAYARLTVTVPGTHDGKHFGLYTLVENPDENWAKDRFGTKKGLILKPVTQELFIYKGADWAAYNQAYDPKTDLTQAQKQRVFAFAKLVTQADDAEFARRLPEFLDVDEFSRFMAVTVWLSSTDSILMMGQNFIVYLHPETEKFLFVPWDLDRAFGNFFTPNPEELSVRKAWGEDNRFLNRVMNVPAVRDAYLARLEEFQKTLFQPAQIARQVDELAALLRPAVKEEGEAKLVSFNKVVAGERAETGDGGFGGFMRPGPPIKTFTAARHQAVADQLAGKSEGQPLGGFGGPGGFGRGGPGRGGPGRGGPGGPGGPGGGFGPGMFLGPVLVEQADADKNGQVSAAEFDALATRWFAEWDTDKDGSLNTGQLAAGLGTAFPMPRFGPPPGR